MTEQLDDREEVVHRRRSTSRAVVAERVKQIDAADQAGDHFALVEELARGEMELRLWREAIEGSLPARLGRRQKKPQSGR